MGTFRIILLDIMLVSFPLIMYQFYIVYNKNLNKPENELFLNVAILSSTYFALYFEVWFNPHVNLLFLNIPLLIAFVKIKKIPILFIIIIIIQKSVVDFNWNMYIIVFENIIYCLLSYYLIQKKDKKRLFIILFLLSKSLVFIFESFILCGTHIELPFTKNVAYAVSFFISAYLVLKLFELGTKIIKYHMNMKDLEQNNQIQSSLFRITHEIKNPIAVCKGYLDMFDVNKIEHSKKYVPILKEEINRTLLLLQDYLCFTKINVEKDIIDINLLLEDVIESYTMYLKSHNIKLEKDLFDDEIYIEGDYNRLTQVFINIIKNSSEAIVSNGKIYISSRIINNYIVVEIIDNGIGIDKDNLDKIKEPFFTTKQNGTGLGVLLSHEIVKAHSGNIEYESELGSGTKVTINIPLTSDI